MKKDRQRKRGKKVSRRISSLKEETGKRCKKQVDATKFQTNGREIQLIARVTPRNNLKNYCL